MTDNQDKVAKELKKADELPVDDSTGLKKIIEKTTGKTDRGKDRAN